jgi:hypothetical protein
MISFFGYPFGLGHGLGSNDPVGSLGSQGCSMVRRCFAVSSVENVLGDGLAIPAVVVAATLAMDWFSAAE